MAVAKQRAYSLFSKELYFSCTTRFHGLPIINAVGLRREESTDRRKKPISQPNKKLLRAGGLGGRDYYPILEWKLADVWAAHRRSNFSEHSAYTVNGNTRVSCSVCVLASLHDLQASLRDQRNHPAYLRVVDLEAESSFSFQPSRWLGEVRQDLLTDLQRAGIERAKAIAQQRRRLKARIPEELRFDKKGWPRFVPALEQCAILADVRAQVGKLTGLPVRFTTATAVRERYEELFKERRRREERKRHQGRANRKAARKVIDECGGNGPCLNSIGSL